MKKTLQNKIIEKLQGAKFRNDMEFKYEVYTTLKNLVKEFEYEERMEICKEDAEEFLERARKLFVKNRNELLEEIAGEYSKNEEEFVLQTMFTRGWEFEELADEYEGFNCLCYYQEQKILKDIHFYDDLIVCIASKKEYLISTDFNYLYVDIEYDENEEFIIIKDINIYETL